VRARQSGGAVEVVVLEVVVELVVVLELVVELVDVVELLDVVELVEVLVLVDVLVLVEVVVVVVVIATAIVLLISNGLSNPSLRVPLPNTPAVASPTMFGIVHGNGTHESPAPGQSVGWNRQMTPLRAQMPNSTVASSAGTL
jgi:hypothetical protein